MSGDEASDLGELNAAMKEAYAEMLAKLSRQYPDQAAFIQESSFSRALCQNIFCHGWVRGAEHGVRAAEDDGDGWLQDGGD